MTDTQDLVFIVEHDPDWSALFEAEHDLLVAVLGPEALAVEHIGSTSVPGLAAKPVIDVMVAIEDLVRTPALVPRLERVGYAYSPRSEELADRRFFRKPPPPGPRTHHLHMTTFGGGEWHRHLRFRDLLRSSPELCVRYETLKRELAVTHRADHLGYANAKDAFIARELASA